MKSHLGISTIAITGTQEKTPSPLGEVHSNKSCHVFRLSFDLGCVNGREKERAYLVQCPVPIYYEGEKESSFDKIEKNGNEENASPTGGEEKDREKFNPQHSHKHKDKQKQRQPNSV